METAPTVLTILAPTLVVLALVIRLIMLSPSEFGLPSKFASWRSMQAEAIELCASSNKRFIVQAAPTGFGKSPVYIASSILNGGRTIILTSTKGLQTQLMNDFHDVGLVDMRGMNNYTCMTAVEHGLSALTSCAEGPCHFGAKCRLRDSGCQYYDAYRIAAQANLVVTNYAYWMHANKYGPPALGVFDLMILDEAHNVPNEVSKFVGVTLEPSEISWLLHDGRVPNVDAPIQEWNDWATDRSAMCRKALAELEDKATRALGCGDGLPSGTVQRGSRLRSLQRALDTVAHIDATWAVERQDKRIRLEPVWPAPYVEDALLRNTSKVVLFSATIRPKTMELLGINKLWYDFHEYSSSFPKERRPIIHVPTIAVKFSSNDAELRTWVTRIDQIIARRQDRKGIIHVTSYNRRDLLVRNSEYRRIMLWHSHDDTAEVVERFRRAKPPAVLVSPSVTTGYDFPYEQCEYSIIAKVPFPDFTSALSKRRDVTDADWSRYAAMLAMVQSSGRGMRADDDQCETLIVDDNVAWFIRHYGQFAPKWWLEAYRSERTIPVPLEKL